MGPLTSYVNDFKAWAPLYEVQGGESAKKCSGGHALPPPNKTTQHKTKTKQTQTNKQTDKHTHTQPHKQTSKQPHKQTSKQTPD